MVSVLWDLICSLLNPNPQGHSFVTPHPSWGSAPCTPAALSCKGQFSPWLPWLLFPRSLNSKLHSSGSASVILTASWSYSCTQTPNSPHLSPTLHAGIHRHVMPACWGPGKDLWDFSHWCFAGIFLPTCTSCFVFLVIDPLPSYCALSLAVSFLRTVGHPLHPV